MTTIDVMLGLRLVSVANKREHWSARAKRAKKHRKTAYILVLAELNKLPASSKLNSKSEPKVVEITRIAPRSLDDDNLASSAKAVRDGIADALGIDDSDPKCKWVYEQAKGQPREYDARARILLWSDYYGEKAKEKP